MCRNYLFFLSFQQMDIYKRQEQILKGRKSDINDVLMRTPIRIAFNFTSMFSSSPNIWQFISKHTHIGQTIKETTEKEKIEFPLWISDNKNNFINRMKEYVIL